jgi:hypothetical protein
MITAGICDQQNGELGVGLHSSNPDPVMSPLGQKRASRPFRRMSALPPKADIGTQSWNVRFVPKADMVGAAKTALRDHLVGCSNSKAVGHTQPTALRSSLRALGIVGLP